MKVKRNIIEIDDEKCDGCGLCVPACAEGAIIIENGKAKVVEEKYCDGLGACIGECPNDALKIIEREAEEFDEEAVEKYLQAKDQVQQPEEAAMPCGCPSNQIQSFESTTPHQDKNGEIRRERSLYSLSHWPVKIRLVPPKASFLKDAHLLIAADCTPFAYPDFHQDFIKGKVVLAGCPKFDEVEDYIQKFADIFKISGIKGITVVVMEVPCCQGLPMMVRKGMERAGKNIPIENVIVSARGEILKKTQLVA
ncbi:MAG: 4Fe-4S binding protein [Thermodesulfobacteriota bacterium]|nr:4Fe-4S binding protein [Thermodesulfobacteriota bacterium]